LYLSLAMECIDLFSGIGGISLGLRDFVSVSLYCEWDAGCAAVLSERMAAGDLDPAPIHADIQTLRLPRGLREPVMICGGFPCQDISGIGLQKGVTEGNRSGMFFQIMRLVGLSDRRVNLAHPMCGHVGSA
jgi:DNA (cytosine-5)-methyltransferase 1